MMVERPAGAAAPTTTTNQIPLVDIPADLLGAMRERLWLHTTSVFAVDGDTNPPFKINNSPDSHTLLKLTNVTTGDIVAVFVRAGESVNVGVPVGSYEARVASGRTWYGEAIRFGPQTSYAKLEGLFRFTIEGSRLLGNAVTLTKVTNWT